MASRLDSEGGASEKWAPLDVRVCVSAEEGGGLLLWPPGADPDRGELRCAALARSRRLQAALLGPQLGERAVVRAGRTRRGEILLRCREHLRRQLAVATAVCDTIAAPQ